MKRWVVFVFSFIALIAFSFTGYLYINRDDFISLAFTRALEVKVHLKEISLSRHGLHIKTLHIENPPGSKIKKAFSAHDIKIKIAYLDILKAISGITSDTIKINSISIDKPIMRMEFYGANNAENNWERLLERLTAQTDSPSSRKFTVKKITFTKLQLEAKHHSLPLEGLHPKPIAKIEIRNLGAKKPLSTRELLQAIAKALLIQAQTKLSHKKIADN